MSGNRYLLDTNAIVALLQGNNQLIQRLQKADWVGISIISQIEFVVFPNLTESDRQLFQVFLQRVQVIDLSSGDENLIRMIVEIRQQYRLKLPDAIIAAIALYQSASLMTADQALKNVNELTMVSW